MKFREYIIESGKGYGVKLIKKNGKTGLKIKGMSTLLGIGDSVEVPSKFDGAIDITSFAKNGVRLENGKIYKITDIFWDLSND